MKTEVLIIILLVVVAAGAFGLEALGPDGARIVGIAFCLLLVFLMVFGMFVRRYRKREEARLLADEMEQSEGEASLRGKEEGIISGTVAEE